MSNNLVQLEGNAAVLVTIPSKTFGISVYGNAYVLGGGTDTITQSDLNAITNIVTTASACATPPCTLTTPTLTSSVTARFVAVTEAGVSLAHEFSVFGTDIAVGVTPKVMQVTSYDYAFVGDQLDSAKINLNSGESTDSGFGLDVGVAKDFHNGWQTGFAVRNAVGNKFDTVRGNTIEFKPQARIGISHKTAWSHVAMDVDLTENDPVGLESKTQFVSAGAEFDAFHAMQLRVGYRRNLSDTGDTAPDELSAGLGFSPFGAHLDLGASGNADEIGAALQIGYEF